MRMKIKRSKGVSDFIVSTEMFRHVLSKEDILQEKRLAEHAAKMQRMIADRTLFSHKGETYYDLRGRASYLHSIDARGIRFTVPHEVTVGQNVLSIHALPEVPRGFTRRTDRNMQHRDVDVLDEFPGIAYVYVVLDSGTAEMLKRNSNPVHGSNRRKPWVEIGRSSRGVHKIFTYGEFENGMTVLRVASASWVQNASGEPPRTITRYDPLAALLFTNWNDRDRFIDDETLRRATIDPDDVITQMPRDTL
ncbi:MAG: hypothetical protein RSE62_03595 [Citrobacter sp.]